ncbi:MAG TPA: rhomboid family intramembrane serine protease [Chloroflexota bacterium]|nr:rhomboid family intramembrane serine protease [Chloroflexota bacterium]
MLPLRDSPRARRTPWINLTLILVNVSAFLYELALGPRLDAFLARWAVTPALIGAALLHAPGAHPAVLTTLVTATFLHAGWLHLGGNMLFLWIFGDNVEDRLGHGRYLLFYLVCGIVANLAQVFAAPTSPVPALGASGAIAGVLGAYAITFPGATVSVILPIFFLFTLVDVPALIMIGIWFATQFFSGVASVETASDQSGGVAWWAHVGGFVVGMLLMVLLPKGPRPAIDHGSISLERRAREDTGLVGLIVGTVSMVSQLAQFVILLRLAVVFLGARALSQIVPLAAELVQFTTPLVQPFALVVPPVCLGGHLLELYSIVAVCAYYLIGAGLIWMIAALAYRRRVTRDAG